MEDKNDVNIRIPFYVYPFFTNKKINDINMCTHRNNSTVIQIFLAANDNSDKKALYTKLKLVKT